MDNNSHRVSGNSCIVPAQWGMSMDMDSVGKDHRPAPPLIPLESSRLAAMFDDRSVGAEKFRILESRLQYLRKQRPLKRILITSTVKGEGKSVISANLAVTLGRRHKTLLIDGDLRLSGLVDLLGTQELPGLADWWRQSGEIAPFLRRVGSFKLSCLPAGVSSCQPLELLQSQRMSEMLNEISESFEWVIIDSPPLVLSDPNLWANLSDGTLLVVKQGKTPKRLLRKSLEGIENLKLIGIVMNGSQDAGHRYYGHYYKGSNRSKVASPASAD
jgi:capsular exopolysaccharide synthesis family protein